MQNRDIIVIGASYGGLEALSDLVPQLPADLPAALFVVQHIPSYAPSALAELLDRKGPLKAIPASDGEPIRHGFIYTAPPDHHLLLEEGRMCLVRGPYENRSRPAIDPLFRSAAVAYQSRVIGIVLTGFLNDGTAGLLAIKCCGGIAIVQEPEEAAAKDMPQHALDTVEVDYRLIISKMGAVLDRLVREPASAAKEIPADLEQETRFAKGEILTMDMLGTPVALACPDCGGTLWETKHGEMLRFRCRIGHAYTLQHLLAEKTQGIYNAFLVALRTLEERASMLDRLMRGAQESNHSGLAQNYEHQATEAREQARTLRRPAVIPRLSRVERNAACSFRF